MDRQEQEQLDVQMDELATREREEQIRQIEVSLLQQQRLANTAAAATTTTTTLF